MNFLSHYYYERDNRNCYFVLGTVLPDLLKNADKSIVLHPEKLDHPDSNISSLIAGWKKHLEVDRYFHSSEFFLEHSHALKLELAPIVEGTAVKPFFLGHIAIELILDNLLITTGEVNPDDFYDHLDSCADDTIASFLTFSGMENTDVFLRFFDMFKRDRYLHTYAETHQIAYALKRICMRVWPTPFTPAQEADIDRVLTTYRQKIINKYMTVFDTVGEGLTSGAEKLM
ncbi:hypothetical protein LT679_06825 [Mucilaginibacter roseus]|uniref:DUF479 domain-containing protein n=1 Tax=Mucilaginibacter roseus TaxID=1528868 RepID=A0ABS8U386_9SPHI|nr:hypothetical protein [Mucilaginibacter roseus]MCD8740312.1 hypothetical protein [Mucilaginibacter roseus]